MALTDLSFPVTAKSIGPRSVPFVGRPKVFYLKSSDLMRMNPDVTRSATIIKVTDLKKKVELYETPDEFLAMQALSQGATSAAPFVKNYAVAAPTSSATAADQTTLKYYNEVITNVASAVALRLPDPFVKRLVVINNLTTGAISVLGRGTTTPIYKTSSTQGGPTAAYVIQGGERVHFLAPTAATAGTTAGWYIGVDVGA